MWRVKNQFEDIDEVPTRRSEAAMRQLEFLFLIPEMD